MKEKIEKIARGIGIDIKELFLETPQWGPFHKEGYSLESHISLMFEVLKNCLAGVWDGNISDDVASELQDVAIKKKNLVEQHIVLHDKAKGNCMTFLYEDGHTETVTAKEWETMRAGRPVDDYQSIMKEREVKQISYLQKLPDGSVRTHGKVAAKELMARGGFDSLLLKGIEMHEIAFQFASRDGGVNIPLFEKFFSGLSEEEVLYMLLVNYIDQMACTKDNGQPDISAFLALLKTWQAWKKLSKVQDFFTTYSGKVNKKRLDRLLGGLRKDPSAFNNEDIKRVISQFLEKVKISKVDEKTLRGNLEAVDGLPTDLLENVVEDMLREGQISSVTGRKLGRFNKAVRELIR
jgi:small nuclear ribonucleoprotein (snRNP)-like protein